MFLGKRKKDSKESFQKVSYSQCGEDVIMDFVFSLLRIEKPVYIDIGAHHPYYLSNTAFFYLKGCKGICVEPDPILNDFIRKERPNDICLNVGVSDQTGQTADFYIMNATTLNTFSKVEAERYSSYEGKKIEKIIKTQLLTVNEIIEKYLKNISPNIVSIDVEGMDMVVVRSFDFSKYRPEVFCIETLTYTENNTEEKQKNIIDYMLTKGYFLYADTFINSIFVDIETWKKR